MKICIVSDTHSRKVKDMEIPLDTDILIHCGDFSYNARSLEQLNIHLKDLNEVKAKHTIFIAGNHDWVCENYSKNTIDQECKKYNITYLQDSMIEIEGLKIYGSPYTPKFGLWAFMKKDDDLKEIWENIPENLDILITHGPPYGILDQCGVGAFSAGQSVGSKTLLEEVLKKKPKIHCFGHIHRDQNQYMQMVENGIHFINAAVVNEAYILTREPIIMEL